MPVGFTAGKPETRTAVDMAFETIAGSQVGKMPHEFIHRVVRVLKCCGYCQAFTLLEKAEKNATAGRVGILVNQSKVVPGFCRGPCLIVNRETLRGNKDLVRVRNFLLTHAGGRVQQCTSQ